MLVLSTLLGGDGIENETRWYLEYTFRRTTTKATDWSDERLSLIAETQQVLLSRADANANVSLETQLQELREQVDQQDTEIRLLRQRVARLEEAQ